MAKTKKNNKKRKTSDNTENVYLVSYFTWSIRTLSSSPGSYKYEVKTKEVIAKNRYEAYKNSGVTSILNIIPLFGD